MEKQQLPNSTLILVFGILSIVTCCCYGVIGLILGIIAFVLAKKATALYLENPELYKGYQNVKTGKILAIIGIILSVLSLAYYIWIIAYFGIEGLQDQQMIEERMREMMGQ
ncbi:CCC motif membrane protein [uncultured Psychroserpens sp.]|uniref:CCC motif membrane protein n=1 Tax=uncultured Psychroserpens sp. TaxID=255436 RepID=UPI0026200245|nr:CCC motif membrane protein [uncultured Psychroserpens sp.]